MHVNNEIGNMIDLEYVSKICQSNEVLLHTDAVQSIGHYEVDLYKDYYLDNQLISSIKSNNKIINVVASIYASENGFDNCILLNKDKLVCEFIKFFFSTN